ncbi:hypothetical protein NPIL_538681 [Nephila pilipes]|uniref:Uncharacterized protein n=1 Tax=Nephila pilipes TaxID=299642 RepID=A0A8X6TMV0_NEPPI|nr:hypothetical protein NPIL_538681 [Nephila pilipes]
MTQPHLEMQEKRFSRRSLGKEVWISINSLKVAFGVKEKSTDSPVLVSSVLHSCVMTRSVRGVQLVLMNFIVLFLWSLDFVRKLYDQ